MKIEKCKSWRKDLGAAFNLQFAICNLQFSILFNSPG